MQFAGTTPSDQLALAFEFAGDIHRHDRRKNGSPYIGHLLAVASLLLEVGSSEDLVIAGLLYLSCERGGQKVGDLCFTFGDQVGLWVAENTRDRALSSEERRDCYIQQIARASDGGKLISAASRLANLRSDLQTGFPTPVAWYVWLLPLYLSLPDVRCHPWIAEMMTLIRSLSPDAFADGEWEHFATLLQQAGKITPLQLRHHQLRGSSVDPECLPAGSLSSG